MRTNWTLHVEKFAKINVAEVRTTPLMCFVGDNNSGKSYLLSLLWGILTLGKEYFPKSPSEAKSYKLCENWLRTCLGNETEISENVIDLYVQWYNDLLAKNKGNILKRIFNHDVDAAIIEIRECKRNNKLILRWNEEGQRFSSGSNTAESYVKFPEQQEYSREQLLRMNAYLCWYILMEGIAAPLYTNIIKGRRMGEPIYLPASRTGFMLTYPQLVEASIRATFAFEIAENTTSLTLPYVDFLQLITKFEIKSKTKKTDVKSWAAEYIENNMIKGSVSVKKDTIPIIRYKPKGTEKELPLFVSSSIVTEISPLLLLFKSDIDFKSLIIEEPEAHLHPELQVKMSRLIVNLINRGIPVWITTHSDTILQHINNMIMLNNNTENKALIEKYNYKKDDMLDTSNVSMYQFCQRSDGKTDLKRLETTEYGFVVPTFNDALERITEQVYDFQGE